MEAKKITSIAIVSTITILLGLEGWLLGNDEKDDTISEVLHETSKKWMIIPVIAGILIGHWFWPIYNKKGE